MDRHELLAQQFEEHRPHLRAVAYRMLGSLSEADDAVQDAWLRLSRTDSSEVENLGGWLTTVVARVALNMLRSRKTRREQPLDVHVPDPIVVSDLPATHYAAHPPGTSPWAASLSRSGRCRGRLSVRRPP